jgi:hypothetical protein
MAPYHATKPATSLYHDVVLLDITREDEIIPIERVLAIEKKWELTCLSAFVPKLALI